MSDRVALFLPSLRYGGAERVTARLAGALSASGVPIDLVVASPQGGLRDEVAEGVRIVDLQAHRVATSLGGLVAYLRRERPRAMHSVMVHANVIAVWARAMARHRCRLLVSEHIVLSHGLNSPSCRHKRLLLRRLVPLSYARADLVIAVSCDVARDLTEEFGIDPSRIRVIHNPVVSPETATLISRPPAHRWLEDGGPPVVLAVSRLQPHKGMSMLVQAFAMVIQRRSARLLILGEGPERQALEALVRRLGLEEVVELPGFDPNPLAAMARARLFVLCSQYEGLPGALIEALAAGCPVVASDCRGGVREILEEGRHGRLVPTGDPLALAQAIVESFDELPDREALRRRADAFGLEVAVTRYREVLQV